MFLTIFLFEIKYRLKKPGVYLYIFFAFLISFLIFASGSLPLDEKQFINSPAAIEFYVAMMSMGMMLASSAIMGVPLYRDIEYNTKEYYRSYPISESGYFWGRYFGSFFFVVLMAIGLFLGIYTGTIAGPVLGWQQADHYGPNYFNYYAYSFFVLVMPSLFFTSSLFFALVALLRNIKVIYSSGILLFLGYMVANFFIHATTNQYIIHLTDPFAINGVKSITENSSLEQKNMHLIPLKGLFLANRLLWTCIGLFILMYTRYRFSWEQFFSPAKDKPAVAPAVQAKPLRPVLHIDFKKNYAWPVVFKLTRIEILNIIRDNYFWIIIGAGTIFLSIIFSHGPGNFGVQDFPRTSMILFLYNNNFLIFLYCVIIFYTGEVVHRERVTGFSFINDALPPSVWVFNLAKLLTIFSLCLFLCLMPMLIGIAVQLFKGYFLFNFPVYFRVLACCLLPTMVQMMMISFVLHICVRNRFAAIGIGIAFYVLCKLAIESGYMNYRLLLYTFVPAYAISDFDNVGHMLKPIAWFNGYWLLLGGLMLVVAYLFYIRGTLSTLKERMQVARERFKGKTIVVSILLLIAFTGTAGFNYYNVSYLNHYYTVKEETAHAVLTEKKLKRYENLPLPKITAIKMYVNIFPEKQTAIFRALVTVVNKNDRPITQLLLDGDNVNEYSLKYNNRLMAYTTPLLFPRGRFNVFGPHEDQSGYRLYQLPTALEPKDSMVFEVNSIREFPGFANDMYAAYFLHNGTIMGLGLPGLGYDNDEELTDEEDRKKFGLPKRKEEFDEQNEIAGRDFLLASKTTDLYRLDMIVSTNGDQTAIAPGDLRKQWRQNGRNYYEYVCDAPGIYSPPAVISARYAALRDSVKVAGDRYVGIDLYYHPTHNKNLQRYMSAYKDGLSYYSSAFGPYGFKRVRLAESSVYAPSSSSMAATDMMSERYGWNANFQNSDQVDYCYFTAARELAKEWWANQVAPNHTKGAGLITEGLSKYSALVLYEKKYGSEKVRKILDGELDWYLRNTRWNGGDQHPLMQAALWTEKDNKAGIVLFALKDLIGEKKMNDALRAFRDAFAYRNQPPFAGTQDLYQYLKKEVPDSLQYYLSDTWEKITFYDNRIVNGKVVKVDNNHYKVSITYKMEKNYFDEKGNATSAKDLNDLVDVAVFGKGAKDDILYFKKQRLASGVHSIDVIVTGKPTRIGIDPYHKLMDKTPGDNSKDL